MFEAIGSEVIERARSVRLVVLDVDGVLTDGSLHYGPDGEVLKRFHVHDGLGIRLLHEQGYEVAIISARGGEALRRRARDLRIQHLVEGTHDKRTALEQLVKSRGLSLSQCAYLGDDLWDLPALRAVGLPCAVANAHPLVKRDVLHVTREKGGGGAVRELADLLLHAGGRLESSVERLLNGEPTVRFAAIIPARWGSTRLPGKPLKLLGGKAMVLHVCENARKSGAEAVIVASDDERIVEVVRGAGFEALLTAAEHRSGTDRLAQVVREREGTLPPLVVNVQGDEPLLSPELIRAVAVALEERPLAGMATLAAPIKRASEWTNPNIVKVVVNQHGLAQYFSRAPIPFLRDVPPGFEPDEEALCAPLAPLRHIGVYAYRSQTLLRVSSQPSVMQEECESLEQLRALWLGIQIHVGVVDHAPPHGVDTPADLERVDEQVRVLTSGG